MARIALFQNKNKGSVNENLNAGISAIKEAAENGADLILFPEVQLTEFFPQYPGQDVSGYACELDGEIIQAFQAACREIISWQFQMFICVKAGTIMMPVF